MNAHARTAGGIGHDRTGFGEDFDEPLFQRLQINKLRSRRDDEAHALGDLVAAHDGGGNANVFDQTVGAGADECLIDLLGLIELRHRHGIARHVMRLHHIGLKRREIDGADIDVGRISSRGRQASRDDRAVL